MTKKYHISGMKVEARGDLWYYEIQVDERGMRFTASGKFAKYEFLADVGGHFESICNDLESFIEKYYFFGCGGRSHDFGGEPAFETRAVCVNCGAVKHEYMDQRKAVDSVTPLPATAGSIG